MRHLKMIACAGSLLISTPSFAATIQSVTGAVSLNSGSGFTPVASGATAMPGSMVLANSNSSAQIVYDNGCVQNVDPGTTVTVANDPPCQTGDAATNTDTLLVGGLVAAGVIVGVVALSSGGGDAKPASP